jgi:hypothetical protein
MTTGEGDHRRGVWIAREGRDPESREGKSEPLAQSRAGGLFLKRIMGALDSLKCLSVAPGQRIVYAVR